MLKVRIIPCLDVKNGRVVKGINFTNLKDAGDPVEQAEIYNNQGADELCFLDIGASIENRGTIIKVLENTASKCFMPLTVGGGVRNSEDVRLLLMAGADKVSINTRAVENPEIISTSAEKFGNQCIVVAIDVKRSKNKNINSGFEVYTYGGRRATGIDAINWAKKAVNLGAGEILLTSMDRDGTGLGFDIELTKIITQAVTIPVVASGGVGKLKHFVEGIKKGGATGLLAASIFHYGKYNIKQVKLELNNSQIPVRF